MEEEVVVIVTRKQAQKLAVEDAAGLIETSTGLVRRFTGARRFKDAAKLLRALDVVGEG